MVLLLTSTPPRNTILAYATIGGASNAETSFSYMREYKKYAWSGLLCIGVEVVLEITVPLLMADLIDYGVTNADGTYIIKKVCRWHSVQCWH